jgi:cytoskeleton protein RodZ
MSSVGEALRRERLRRNLDLEAVSRELKISPRMLEAIEAEQFEKLPGGVFAKSFVRQYARLLGLDEEDLAGEVQRALGPAPELPLARLAGNGKAASPIPLPRVQEWEAVSEKRRFSWSSPLPALALFVVVIMGCSGIYAWWQRTRHPVLAQSSSAQSTAKIVPPPPAVAQPVSAPPAAPPAAPEQSAPTPAAPPANAAQQPAPATPTAPAEGAAEQAPPPQSALPSNPNAAVRVQVTADEPVWLAARTDGKYLFSGTLDANQSRTLEANNDVVLRLGNAGGVTILLNGKPIGSVGPKGQVRTVQLTSGGFQIVAPKPPVPLDPLRF